MTSSIVSTTEAVAEMLTALHRLPKSPPSLYLDLEGIKLSREGTISILQILALRDEVGGGAHTYLVDIYTLGNMAFSTPTPSPSTAAADDDDDGSQTPTTLKTLLEDGTTPKVFFDVRNDSDALFAHHGIALAGIEDIQLLEYAARPRTRAKKYVHGLARCIEHDLPLPHPHKTQWKASKESGAGLFLPEKGGSWAVLNTRPIPRGVREYCEADVRFLPALYALYRRQLGVGERARVRAATGERVRGAWAVGYRSQGRHKALGPWEEEATAAFYDPFDV